jgi:nucleoside-diphosphate-sugar epimerase
MAPLSTRDLDHVLDNTRDVWPALAGTRLFVTGGTGFVGKWLIETFLYASDKLNLKISATLLTRDPARFRSECPHLANHPSISLLRGDVQSFEFPAGDFPHVIHAATERQFDPDAAQPLGAFDRDIEGTRRVLEFARTHGTRRFLFTSSGAVYGKQPPDLTHIPEDYSGAPATIDTASSYGQAKRVSEFLCAMYARPYGFAALIPRLFAFVGPHLPLDANYAVGNFIRDALSGGPIRITGDGTPYRSYLYAADMAIWLWTILVRGESARPYNVGSGEELTIAELARAVVDVTDPALRIQIAREPVGAQPPARYVPSVERAAVELGLRPLIPLKQGIERTCDWCHVSSVTSGQPQEGVPIAD